jgi:hypothetical protein
MPSAKQLAKAAEIKGRRTKVADYYVRGRQLRQIAEALEVSITTVNGDLSAIRKEWMEARIHKFDVVQERELRKLDLIEWEAWQGWERSQRDAEVRRVKQKSGEEEQSLEQRGQVGDPRFLDIVHKCIERRCKMLGLDKTDDDTSGKEVTQIIEVVVKSTSVGTFVPQKELTDGDGNGQGG